MTTHAPLDETAGDPSRPSTWSGPPSWLFLPAGESDIATPPETRPQLLPLDDLSWENFERLCLRLLDLEAETVHTVVQTGAGGATEPATRMYGRRGQAQFGIDLYARDRMALGAEPPERRYVCLQARRVNKVTKTALRRSVADFLKGKWSSVSRKFIYATSLSAVSTELSEVSEALAGKLVSQSIELDIWDQEGISAKLRSEPKLVDDFFGRAWVSRFCGDEVAVALGQRLDAPRVAILRRELASIYRAAFRVADSGLLALSTKSAQATGLRDRFVTPDLVATTPQGATIPLPVEDVGEFAWNEMGSDSLVAEGFEFSLRDTDADPLLRVASRARQSGTRSSPAEERWSADAWLGTSRRQVIVGDPGAGKSTLLRYMVLDLLSDQPEWRAVAERWGGRLPVWLPFHFFTQRVAGTTGESASIVSAIKAWLEQNAVGHIWPLVQDALADDRLLLVVDGLDEWISNDSGRYAAALVETFAESHLASVVASTRPYGLSRLTLGADWVYARLAPLTHAQQQQLARRYFQTAAAATDEPASLEVINVSVDGFLAEVQGAPDLRAVSGTPLFMVLLIGLRLSSVEKLPDRRFEVYDRAVQLLLAEHPAHRRVAAAVTAQRQRLPDRQTRALLAEVAFVGLSRGDVAGISEMALRRDLIQALSNPDHLALDPAAAGSAADGILDIAEGELGLLVRTGPSELGFLHRMLQEQLAAEHVAEHLTPEAMKDLFALHVGEPSWREVLLGAMWRVNRPVELRELALVIHGCIDEMPSGLRAREVLAETIFGPYALPGGVIHQFMPALIATVESHPYGAHRARVMNSVFSGLESVTTRDAVEECLRRWAVLVDRPSADLVWQVAHLPSDNLLSERVVRLLLLAVENPDTDIAYGGAVSIAARCSDAGTASASERDALKAGLLRILSDPPSGTAAAAALASLALQWRDDQVVAEALAEARSHADESVRIVALGEALGVLRRSLLVQDVEARECDPSSISNSDRRWLAGLLADDPLGPAHTELLVATVTEAVRGWSPALEYCVKRMEPGSGPRSDFAWTVGLRAFGDDERVVKIVCDELRMQQYLWSVLGMRMGRDERLRIAYAPGSRHNASVAAAIEDHLTLFDTQYMDTDLFELAAVDQGPKMRQVLLQSLTTSSFPHWAAEALTQYFIGDSEVRATLRSALLGDPRRASRIATVAGRVLDADEVLPRLLDILHSLADEQVPQAGRHDFVAYAIANTCRERGITEGPEAEKIAAESIELMPAEADRLTGDPTYALAQTFERCKASRSALARLAQVEGHPISPFLRVFRDDPVQVDPFLEEAAALLRSLPAFMRIRLCQVLADRPVTPKIVVRLTRRWADELSERTKSVASLAFHRALIQARSDGLIGDEDWEGTLTHLADQASCYGPDHEARRRAAWVGMCVVGDWTMLEGRVERIGEEVPVGVRLDGPFEGPDVVLLQQLAARWDDLRAHFGDDLLNRLSGTRAQVPVSHVWNALAVVAAQNPVLEQELESAVLEDSDLLQQEGVLAWFISRAKTNPDVAADALVSFLQKPANNLRSIADVVAADPERIGLDREDLRVRLEEPARRPSRGYGNRPLEALAALFPDHATVQSAWREFSAIVYGSDHETDQEDRGFDPHPQTYLAVAYAASDGANIVHQLERDLDWLSRTEQSLYDEAFTRHVARRLRRDGAAAAMVCAAVMDPTVSDVRAAELASLVSIAVPLEADLLIELKRRLEAQAGLRLAPVIQDRVLSVSSSVKTILTRIIDLSENRSWAFL